MCSKPKRVLLVYLSYSSFVARDHAHLEGRFRVRKVQWRGKMSILKMVGAAMTTDVVYAWFAGDHASVGVRLARLFGKKSVVIVGGGDVASVPEIGYGQLRPGNSKRERTIYSIQHADKVLVVDPSLKEDAMKNAGVRGDNIDYLPTGYDLTKYRPSGEKEDVVLTVGYIDKGVIRRKGFDTFVETARLLPELRFVIVGKLKDEAAEVLKASAPKNVIFTDFVSDEELLAWYQRAKVYCQLSRYEGLPNALCEAMLCGCVPVGTEHCGIPTAIGNTGLYVPYGNPKATADAVDEAFQRPEMGRKARERIASQFPDSRRRDGLYGVIDGLLEVM